jgi:phenylacetate-CoA ligase
MGPGVASECIESKDGPVIWEDHFYPEIIDPETGEVLPDGEEGELVFTSLSKEALPIIRYRTRDLTRLLPPTSRTMRRIGKITGRSDDMLIIRGVNVFPSQIEELILKMPMLAPQYQLIIKRDGHLDQLEVLAELRPEAGNMLTGDNETLAQQLANELEVRIKTNVGVSTRVRLVAANGIERTLTGKARRVVDQRPKH